MFLCYHNTEMLRHSNTFHTSVIVPKVPIADVINAPSGIILPLFSSCKVLTWRQICEKRKKWNSSPCVLVRVAGQSLTEHTPHRNTHMYTLTDKGQCTSDRRKESKSRYTWTFCNGALTKPMVLRYFRVASERVIGRAVRKSIRYPAEAICAIVAHTPAPKKNQERLPGSAVLNWRPEPGSFMYSY